MKPRQFLPGLLGLCLLLNTGCQDQPGNQVAMPQVEQQRPPATTPAPPTPPLRENFDGAPQLALFPRIGDYRPENDDQLRLPYWNTFMTHVTKTAGPAVVDSATGNGNRAWSFRSINGLDSIGWFSPLAVEPATSYRIKARLKAELPAGGSAGIGILEFREFLWLARQFTQSLTEEFQSGIQDGVRLQGGDNWQQIDYRFTSGPETRMIHLILFREGPHDRTTVYFDDLSIEKTWQ